MRATTPALCAAILAATSAAQTAPVFSMNDTSNAVSNVIYGWNSIGPNNSAWRITPTTLVPVQSLRIMTGNNYPQNGDFFSLAVYDENPATSLPGNLLGKGSWTILRPISWQGTNLDALVVLQPNTNYWVAFTDPGWSRLPVEPGGVTLPTARLINGVWQSGSGEALKLRLYSNQLDDLNLTPIGSGCAGSSGRIGSLFTNATPRIGSSFYLEGTGFPAGTLALMILGASPNWLSFPIPGGGPGCMLSAEPRVLVSAFTGTSNERAPLAVGTAGHLDFQLAIPNNSALAGVRVQSQILAFDAGWSVPMPLMASNALDTMIF